MIARLNPLTGSGNDHRIAINPETVRVKVIRHSYPFFALNLAHERPVFFNVGSSLEQAPRVMAVYPISRIWLLGERLSPEAITRMAGVPLTGHLFSQIPQPTHCRRFT